MEPTSSPKADLFSTYQLGAAYDEMFVAPLEPRRHYRALFQRLSNLTPEEFSRRKAMSDLSMLQDGVGFTVYRQEEGIERVWPMDPVPRIIPADEWQQIEKGLVAAADRPQPLPQGRLSRAADSPRPRVARRAHLPRRVLPPRVRRRSGSARRLHPRLRHGSHPRRRRTLPRARGQLPHAVGRELHAAEPPGAAAGVSADLRVLRRAHHRGLPGGAARRAEVHRAGRPSGPARGVAEPRHVQLGLLRAHLSRAAHGSRAGGGPRPFGRSQPRLHAHHGRPGACRRHLSADRR